MGCTNSVASTGPQNNDQQPVKDCTVNVKLQSTKVIRIPSSQSVDKQNPSKPKNQLITKKQQKIQQLKNNKDFIQVSIQTTYCVNKLLNTLAQNQIFFDQELKGLMTKNNQTLITKQNRYKNLEAREEKMQQQLLKQIQKNTKSHPNLNLRKTLPPKTQQQFKTQRKSQKKTKELTTYKSHRIYQPIIEEDPTQERYNFHQNKQNHHSKSDYLKSEYKQKFVKRIDMFRSQVNTLVSKENIQI